VYIRFRPILGIGVSDCSLDFDLICSYTELHDHFTHLFLHRAARPLHLFVLTQSCTSTSLICSYTELHVHFTHLLLHRAARPLYSFALTQSCTSTSLICSYTELHVHSFVLTQSCTSISLICSYTELHVHFTHLFLHRAARPLHSFVLTQSCTSTSLICFYTELHVHSLHNLSSITLYFRLNTHTTVSRVGQNHIYIQCIYGICGR